MQTDCIGGCEKKDNTERSQALLGTTNLFRKLRREESAAKERTKAKTLLIFARLLLPYHENGCAVYLPFSIGTVSLASQTLYRLVLARSERCGHSCTHFWCSWNALTSVWDFCLKQDMGRITLRV